MLVYIRGAGALASGIALRLYRANCKIIMSDLDNPRALRRNVCFSEAIRLGQTVVEGVKAMAAKDPEEAVRVIRQNAIAVMRDPDGDMRGTLPFDACIDVIFSEQPDTAMTDAPIVIGVGDGFIPGENCHAAVSAFREGRNGRVYYESDMVSGKPGAAKETENDVVRFSVPRDGLFYPVSEIGDPVKKGETVAVVDNEPVLCPADGIIGGILPEGAPVTRDRLCGEVLLHAQPMEWKQISEKALAVGGGVLEALIHCELM